MNELINILLKTNSYMIYIYILVFIIIFIILIKYLFSLNKLTKEIDNTNNKFNDVVTGVIVSNSKGDVVKNKVRRTFTSFIQALTAFNFLKFIFKRKRK